MARQRSSGRWEASRHRRGTNYYLGMFNTYWEAEEIERLFDQDDPPTHQNRLRRILRYDITTESGICHVAGIDIRYENHLRQRCAWCYALLIDDDLTMIQVRTEDLVDGEFIPAIWPVGAFIQVEGEFPVMTSVIEVEPHEDGSIRVPDNCCMRLPKEMTASEHG